MTTKRRPEALDAERLFLEAERHEQAGDYRKAFECLSSAARLGHHMSQVNLGNFCASGTGVRRSRKKAAYWYRTAYRNGNSGGAFNLAIDRRNEGNIRSAVIWFKKAVAMSNGEACVELARIYSARKGGQKAAADLLRQAIRMSRYEISEAAKEEAQSLLREMTTT